MPIALPHTEETACQSDSGKFKIEGVLWHHAQNVTEPESVRTIVTIFPIEQRNMFLMQSGSAPIVPVVDSHTMSRATAPSVVSEVRWKINKREGCLDQDNPRFNLER